MNGLQYSASFENVSISATQDIFELVAAAGVPIILHRIELSWGVTAQEIVRLQILRRTTTGSGGSAVTPRSLNSRMTVAAAGAVNRNVTTPGTAGDVVWTYQQNLVVPVDELFGLDQLKIVVPGGGRIGLNLASAPAAARSASATIFFSEV
jgi:hypothetical protein